MHYNFTLRDNNEKAYRSFVWFLFFLHIVAAGVFALNEVDKSVRLGIYILIGFYVMITILYFLFRERKKAVETFSLTMALLYANFWLRHVGAIALIIFGIVFLFVTTVQNKKTKLLFTETGVHLTRVFKTILYPWDKIENVILKDGLLTIDFLSNKLIQAEIATGAEQLNEDDFNLYCKQQLQYIA
jgi:hypothetical protein